MDGLLDFKAFRLLLQLLPFTALASFVATLWACFTVFVNEGPHGGVRTIYGQRMNFTFQWELCTEYLCDISAYGGWPDGREGSVFQTGLSVVSLQLLVLVAGRLALLAAAARPEEVNRPLVCTDACCCCCCGRRPMRLAAVCGLVAALCLIPVAFIPFWVSPLHFLSAFLLFGLLFAAQFVDATMQLRMLSRGRADESCQSSPARLSLAARLLVLWNGVCSGGSILCFVGWIVTQLSLLEWVAAVLPFVYFLAWSFQVDWLWNLSRAKAEMSRSIVGESISMNQVSSSTA